MPLSNVLAYSLAAAIIVAIPGPSVLFAIGRALSLGRTSASRAFRDGVAVGVSNPKSLVFLGALLPQFVSSGGWPQAVQLLVLGVIFCVIAVALDSAWVFGAAAARGWFGRSPARLSRLRGLGGVLMIVLGLVTLTVHSP